MNEHTRKGYVAAARKVQDGTCPVCGSALCNNYCKRHAYVKSGIGTEIDGIVYDEKLLELASGCNT